MRNLDIFHKIITFPDGVFNRSIYSIDDILAEDYDIDRHIVPVMSNYVYHVNDRSDSNFLKQIILKLLAKLPIQDIDAEWSSSEQARREVGQYFDNVIHTPKVQSLMKLSEKMAGLSQVQFIEFLATKGMGAHLMEYDASNKSWKINLNYMHEYEVRSGLLPYGCSAHFTEDFKLKHISLPFNQINGKIVKCNTNYTDVHPHWQMAYNTFTSSLITHVTIVNHAVQCHFILAGGMLATYHEKKDTIHPHLAKLIEPFIFRTGDINSAALEILINPGGIVSRIFSFTPTALDKYMRWCFDSYRFEHPLAKLDLGVEYERIPYFKDAQKYYDIIERFVSKITESIYQPLPTENVEQFLENIEHQIPGILDGMLLNRANLNRAIASHIYNVSVWHEQIGNMTWYLLYPELIHVKTYRSNPNMALESEQNTYQNVFLALMTSVTNMPKLNCDLWKSNDSKYKEIYLEFQRQLNVVQPECEHLNVNYLECSVSL